MAGDKTLEIVVSADTTKLDQSIEAARMKRDARSLMNAARNTAMDMIKENVMAYPAIVEETMPFVKAAAKIQNRQYKNEGDKEAVVFAFLTAMRQYSQLSGLPPITRLDLTA